MKKKLIMVGILLFIMVGISAFLTYRYVRYHDTWTLTQYADDSGNQGMFYTLKNNYDGYFIIVDGGWPDNEAKVRQVISDNGGVVDAWFLTHYHTDHVEAFNAIAANPDGIVIKKIYATPLDKKYFLKVAKEWDNVESYQRFCDVTKNMTNLSYPSRGDKITLDGLQVTFFNSYDKTLIHNSGDIPNNDSLVFKISGKKDSILFLGDVHDKKLGQYLLTTYQDALDAEYVQAGHHGNNSLPVSFYEELDMRIMFFDAPEWLMTGEDYSAKDLQQWCNNQGMKTYDFRTAPNCFSFR